MSRQRALNFGQILEDYKPIGVSLRLVYIFIDNNYR